MYPNESTFYDLCEKLPLEAASNPFVRLAMDDKTVSEGRYKTAPVLLCEYAHCMENSLGNFYKYIDGFEQNEHMCGGFIWDFVDQAIRRVGRSGEEWLYGDDFKEIYKKAGFKKKFFTGGDGIFCCNGIVAADRCLHPAAAEVKKGYQVLHVEPTDSGQNVFRVVNNQLFSDLSAYRLLWRLERNGEPVMEDEIPPHWFASTPPGGHATLRLEQIQLEALRLEDVQQLRGEGEFTIIFSFVLSEDTLWGRAGYELAFSQIMFAPAGIESFVSRANDSTVLKSKMEDESFFVKGDGFEYIFDHGVLSSIIIDGVELLRNPVIPNLWRAPTDNDYGFGNFFKPAKRFMTAVKWKKAGASQKPHLWYKNETADGFEIISEWKNPMCRKLQTVVNILKDGKMSIELLMQPKKTDAIRAGVQLTLSNEFNNITWYGRGPHECYPDRKTGARISRFSSSVEKLSHHYVRPQENGARCDVRWLSVFSEKRSAFIRDLIGDGLIFSAWHYEQEDLVTTSHDHLLIRKPITTLNIDSAMCGVGGDLPGITSLHDEFKLPGNKKYRLRVGFEFSKNV